ncbi:MAG: fibronectin type III domain-containing protein, partial [Gammaproteobacteria bacterium]|nr:fibronectin type III domain-containing protein [Gammaproteobacteria bacterium]
FGAAATAQSTPRTVPGAPRSPGVTIADGELQLTWSAPANNGGAAITDYRLRWKLATAIAFASGDARAVGTATSATITGLTNGSAYDVEIAAQNAAGFGAASAFQAIPRAAAGVPGVPQSVRLVSNTRQSLRLAWEPPLDNGGAAISGYRLSLRGGGSSSVAATARSFTLQNLTPGTLYTVTLSARNSVGTGPVAVVQGVPGGATAPQSAAATPGDGELRVAWSAPDNNGGATITGYRLRWKLASAAAFAGGDTRTVGAVTSATITGLTNGEAYDVEITAQTSRGFGAPATVQSTPGLTPSAPQSATATPGNAELQIAWSAPADNGGSAILTYRLRWKLASAAAFAAGDVIRVGADTTTATITGLTNGETYEVEIAAQNSDGFGAAAILQSTLPTPPGAPQNPTATPGNTELQIAWSAPADAADAAILTYRLRWKDADDASFASGDVILTG